MARCHANDGKEDESLIDRRSYLRMGVAAAALAATPALATTRVAGSSTLSPEVGGDEYGNTVSRSAADDTAGSAGELQDALSAASSGDVVYLTSSFDTEDSFSVPGGVTVAGDRGIDGSSGPVISTGGQYISMFELGDGARLTGVHVAGPIEGYVNRDVSDLYPAGVGIEGDNCEVDNCEVTGFAYAGVFVGGDSHVHHSAITSNSYEHLGYGVDVRSGNPLIEYNYFESNRHSIACEGSGGYTAQYNYFGTDIWYHTGAHPPANGPYVYQNNTFEGTQSMNAGEHGGTPAIVIRGTPSSCVVKNNWFYQSTPPEQGVPNAGSSAPILQEHTSDWANMDLWDNQNHYGSDEPASDIGAPRGGSSGGTSSSSGDSSSSNSSSETDSGSHTLTIESDGPKVSYDLGVEGTIEKSGAQDATFDKSDAISGSTVSGRVWGGRDSYTFAGNVTEFTHDGPITVYLDGTTVDPDTLG